MLAHECNSFVLPKQIILEKEKEVNIKITRIDFLGLVDHERCLFGCSEAIYSAHSERFEVCAEWASSVEIFNFYLAEIVMLS